MTRDTGRARGSRPGRRLGDHVRGRPPDVFRAAGFADVRVTARVATVFGSLSLFAARRPDAPAAAPRTPGRATSRR